MIDSLYFVLGFLIEYDGRTVRHDDPNLVEFLFSDEANKAEILSRNLEKLATTPIEKEVNESGCIIFRSAELAALINGCYKVVRPGPFAGSQDLFASRDLFREKSRLQEVSYLAGAYARFGDGNSFRMSNSQHKIDLVAELLCRHGCEDISVTYYPTYVPRAFVLSVKPPADLAVQLGIPALSV